MPHTVFVTGATGYIGQTFVRALLARRYPVCGLVRPGAEARLPYGAMPVIGNALDATTFAERIPRRATLVHLVGTPHPSPAKAREFVRVDLASIEATTAAAQQAEVEHLIYMSVAHPAPVMRAYVEVRQRGEALIERSGIPATILRPWYVLGPGHRWPYVLLPFYALLRWIPVTRPGAERLALVTLDDIVNALVSAVEAGPPEGLRILDVPQIRAMGERAR